MTYYPPPMMPAPTPRRLAWWQRGWAVAGIGVLALLIGAGAGAGAGKGDTKTSTVAAGTVTARPVISTMRVTATRTRTLRPVIRRVVATRTRVITETYTPPPKPAFSDGTYKVGVDINPGEYRTAGGGECYWQVSSDAGGNNILNNNNFSGPAYVNVSSGQYLEVDGGCDWRHT